LTQILGQPCEFQVEIQRSALVLGAGRQKNLTASVPWAVSAKVEDKRLAKGDKGLVKPLSKPLGKRSSSW
jgi:hypothetical protein